MRLTKKQELFTQNIFKGMTQRESWIQAGYSSKYPVAHIDHNACVLANSSKVKARYAELNAKLEDEAIASPRERRQRLTVFLREDVNGKYGISRQSNISASDQLNRMDRIYDNTPAFQDNRQYNFIVQGEEDRKKLALFLSGERPTINEEE